MQRIATAEEFTHWVTHARPGATVSYYSGFLMKDKMSRYPYIIKSGIFPADFYTTSKAMEFSDMGFVHLVQKRLGDGEWDYLAVKADTTLREVQK